MQNSVTFLNASLQKGCLEPFYLLGEMFRAGEITKPDDEAAYEYYVIAASYKNPFAYFQLAQYYKKGKVV